MKKSGALLILGPPLTAHAPLSKICSYFFGNAMTSFLGHAAYAVTQPLVTLPVFGRIWAPEWSGFVIAYSGFQLVGMLTAGFNEASPNATPYSKFAKEKQVAMIQSRLGMLIIYTPAFVIGLYLGLKNAGTGTDRFCLFNACITAHFFKRMTEVLFLHVYSGKMEAGKAMTIISCSYAFNTFMVNRFAGGIPAHGFDESSKAIGLLMFFAGQGINMYHHWLLANLRSSKSDKELSKQPRYVTPVGGFFSLVTAPHFLGELIAWYGLATLSQHIVVWFLCGFMTSYLTGRAYATTKYYREKIEDYPKERGHIFPFIF